MGALLIMLLMVCYGNTLHASWQYDDFGNIVHNTKVHMTQWSWQQLRQSLSAGLDFQVVSRPLAYLSFALNHKLGGLNVFGYHVVNICIHWTAALFLFLFIRDTLRLPLLKERFKADEVVIAALAAVFWASHPIQVTAVTYIVQRMASMAGMFYIMTLYGYLRFRTANGRVRRVGYLLLSGLFALCALLTKENTLMLGYVLILYDFLLIRGIAKAHAYRSMLWVAAMTLAVGLVGLLYTNLDWSQLTASYDIRPFTPLERVLTQSRVIILYLSLLAMPMTSRMAMLHDIQISHGLLSPGTTAVAIGALFFSVVALALVARKYPFFAFCGLFFLFNHLVEGSFLNLELIYEHRNYIPSMLIFAVPAALIVKFISKFRYRPIFQWMIGLAVFFLLLSHVYTTWSYNRIHQTEFSLWFHTVHVSPRLSLAHSNLGNAYWGMGFREKAHDEFRQAFALNRYNNIFHKGSVLYNLGLYDAYQKQDYQRALQRFQKAKLLYGQNFKIWYQLGLMQIVTGRIDTALVTISDAMAHWPRREEFQYLAALAYLKSHRYAKAAEKARSSLELNPKHEGSLMVMAQSYYGLEEYDASIRFWERLLAIEPRNLHAIIALIDINDETNRREDAIKYFRKFNRLKGDQDIDAVLEVALKSGRLGAYTPVGTRVKELYHKLSRLD